MYVSRHKNTYFPMAFVYFPLVLLLLLITLYGTGYIIGTVVHGPHPKASFNPTPALSSTVSEHLTRCILQRNTLVKTHQVTVKTLKSINIEHTKLQEKHKALTAGKGGSEESPAECVANNGGLNHGNRGAAEGIGESSAKGEAAELKRTAGLLESLTHEVEYWLKKRGRGELLCSMPNSSSKVYSIVFDAGSTGSRVHVYRYNLSSNPCDRTGGASNCSSASLLMHLRLENELFVENHEPLSRFGDPKEAASSLVPLLNAAKTHIPQYLQECVGIELKATAGLRRVGTERAEAVLNAVRREFRQWPFRFHSEWDSVRILEGREEGPLAWLTVNFLVGALHSDKKPASILDLGGGSTQIVMCPDDPKVLDGHEKFVDTFHIDGRPVKLYQHSYEGNGLNAARERLLDAVVASHNAGNRATGGTEGVRMNAFPCFPQGYTHEKSGLANNAGADGVTPSLDKCVALFQQHVVRDGDRCHYSTCSFNGIFQPNVQTAVTGPVYAFSFYFDLLSPYLEEREKPVRLQDIVAIAKRVCSSMKPMREILREGGAKQATHPSLRPEWECLHLSYVVTLLRHGFHYSLEQEFHIAKKIDGYEAAWTLGASLVGLERGFR
uniref:Putative guanosine diphosphatase n=1 Tax=Trypanosoma congolense (strain IL3000) TaxID=1068625 RepID=G0URY6_TRYCI|nr:putative guanosine diphosphatase [Trypanosoma congolense IL3000]